ncbi:hypothetical protein ACIRPK_26490 [Kitasatospora sp. NPDC101801]|uniref:hypothetical protein n=1 Tax=Kitasatospora sp. NPDC101801 TaxID=3364103 RepID=UPI00381F2241
MDLTDRTRTQPVGPARTEPQIDLLSASYSPAIIDGQIIAVPLRPDQYDGTQFVPALIDGQVAPIPVFNPFSAIAVQAQPAPAAPAQPPADPGLPRSVQQGVLLGSVALVAAGGFVLLSGAGAGLAAEHADGLTEVLMWVSITVVAVAAGVLLLLGKFKAMNRAAAAGGAASATATGDNSSATATGPVYAWSYRPEHRTTNIGQQSAGWKGTVNNNG